MLNLDQDDYIEKISYHLYNSIKVSISLYNFRKKFFDKITKKNNTPKQKIILIDKIWFSNYKKFYFCEEVIELIKVNKLTSFAPGVQKLLFNNIFNSFKHYIYKNSNPKLLLFYNKKDEFPKVKYYNKNSNFGYISDFEIINEEIYTNLIRHMGDLNITISRNNNISFDYIIFEEKIIIKYIRAQEICYNLLIGHIDKYNSNYFPEIFVKYFNKTNLEEEFNKFFDPNCNIISEYLNGDFDKKKIKDITNDIIKENNDSLNIKYFLSGFKDINPKNIDNEDLIEKVPEIDCNKIIKFFMKLYLEYNNIKNILNNNNKKNEELEFFLINKIWINNFKEKYCYSEFEAILKSIHNFNAINENNFDMFLKNISPEFISKLEKLNIDEMIYDLSNIFLSSNNYDYCDKAKIIYKDYIKIYKNFELWTQKTLDFFKNIGFTINFEPKKVKCYFDEKHIFLLTKNNSITYLNIYQLNDIFYFEPQMVIKCEQIKIILEKIKKGSFIKYLYSITSDNNKVIKINQKEDKGLAFILSKEGKIYDKINRKKKRFDILIQLKRIILITII